MLDISFFKIAVIGAVALVVLGPERLPKVARTAGHLFGRLQRYVSVVKADIAREMESSELSKIKQEVTDAARSFEKTVQQHTSDIESEAKQIQAEAQKTDAEATAQASADTSKLPVEAAHDAGPNPAPVLTSEAYPSVAPVAVAPVATAAQYGQGMFDFGIEPSRPSVISASPATGAESSTLLLLQAHSSSS